MKKLFIALVMAGTVPWAQSGITITPWRPIFKGVEHAIGTNTPDGSIPRLQVANCVRIDLSDPDVQLFTTPPATNLVLGSVETYTMSVSNFLKTYHLAVASDANFYNASP